jgi:hypothetical protein
MSSLPLILYPPDSHPHRGNLAFTFGSEATTVEANSCYCPDELTDGYCVLCYRVLVYGAMTMTVPVEDLNSSAEGYRWYPYVPLLELRVSPRLHVLGQYSPLFSVSGAGHPELRHFGYIV